MKRDPRTHDTLDHVDWSPCRINVEETSVVAPRFERKVTVKRERRRRTLQRVRSITVGFIFTIVGVMLWAVHPDNPWQIAMSVMFVLMGLIAAAYEWSVDDA